MADHICQNCTQQAVVYMYVAAQDRFVLQAVVSDNVDIIPRQNVAFLPGYFQGFRQHTLRIVALEASIAWRCQVHHGLY